MKKIKCKICGGECHAISNHLKVEHPEMTIAEYQRRFPTAPIFSEYAMKKINEQIALQEKSMPVGTKSLGGVFNINSDAAYSSVGKRPIPITVNENLSDEDKNYLPEVNDNYVFDVKELKYVMYGVENNIPVYIWGHKGTGKTELVEQICARTNRPLIRVQHTVNTEESQIVGQWVVRDGSMQFELGSLPLAMINGWTYLADEYDFAMPNVVAVYQSVLEGKPLMIKEAPSELRVIKPHKNFRFIATGNTNGTGDETGLYQGTTIQNSANYDRFGIVVNKHYLPREKEVEILISKTLISTEEARDLVEFASVVRDAFSAGQLGDTISPRTLLFIAQIGHSYSSIATGIQLAFLNKLSSMDKETCIQFAMRYYGNEFNV